MDGILDEVRAGLIGVVGTCSGEASFGKLRVSERGLSLSGLRSLTAKT